jgi:hypothetical protein
LWVKIPAYLENLNNKERLELIIKLLPYAVPKYTHKTISDDTPELPIFDQIQIITSVDEKKEWIRFVHMKKNTG